jgi:hypothetical protein
MAEEIKVGDWISYSVSGLKDPEVPEDVFGFGSPLGYLGLSKRRVRDHESSEQPCSPRATRALPPDFAGGWRARAPSWPPSPPPPELP